MRTTQGLVGMFGLAAVLVSFVRIGEKFVEFLVASCLPEYGGRYAEPLES